jgi:hypothetical protein
VLHGQMIIAATAGKCCVSNSCICTGPVCPLTDVPVD